MSKHAYCIIAHNDKYCLTRLLSLLDDERNDIFLLLDKKLPASFQEILTTTKSRLTIIDENDRIDVRWGHISLIEAELTVFRAAVGTDKYDFIHLISGVDLPLKTQDYIHNFFDQVDPGTLFVSLNEDPKLGVQLAERLRYYQFFTRYQKSDNRFLKLTTSFLNKATILFQKFLRIKRHTEDYRFGKGSNWVTISDEFCRYIVGRSEFILKKFRYIKCADEIFIQSEILNSRFSKLLYRNSDGQTDHMRKLEFKGDSPRVFTIADYDSLINSPDLFARKFSSVVDREVIDRIAETCSR